MTVSETSADCAGSSSSCCATVWTSAALAAALALAAACGNARPPPPAHLDPEYADAGPPILLHEPWPQTGPFFCHAVVAPDGQRTSMCSRASAGCATWREANQRQGFDVGACSQELEASCFFVGERELCFRTLAQCEQMRDDLAAPVPCKTLRAVWEPK